MPSQSTPSDKLHDQRSVRYAAAYVRISTGHQQFSIENQMQIICAHPQMRGAEIVRTYSDEARSGLSVNGRNAFQRLISDVTEGRANFDLILVYDVSRRGRFQNVDESAHYEFICRKAGVSIEYCADGFANDGSMLSTLIKGVKRAVAAEHMACTNSRELSAKKSDARSH